MPPDRARPPDSRDGGRKQEQGPERVEVPGRGILAPVRRGLDGDQGPVDPDDDGARGEAVVEMYKRRS